MFTNNNGHAPRANTPIEKAPSPDGKAIATQLAELAIAGHVVHMLIDGDYLVCKYGMTRYCKNFAELQAFARQLGVKQ
jgi:hypothetical protein